MSPPGNLIFIDSESESEQPAKRPRIDAPKVPMASFKKPFMASDSESDNGVKGAENGCHSEASGDSDIEGNKGYKRQSEIRGRGKADTSVRAESDSDSDSDDDTNNQVDNSKGDEPIAHAQATESPLSDTSDSAPSVDSSDLEAVTSENSSLSASKRAVYETRKYLKEKGVMHFLQEYLPATAGSEDIINLILKLGFVPKNMPPLGEGENLLELIKLLNTAMKQVRILRPRLENFSTVDDVLNALNSCNRIMVITGAGISTSLGIPDFRSSHGFYSQLSELGLSDPQEVFDLDLFHQDPSIFYSIAHMILPPDNIYAPLHKFIKLLQDKGKLLRNYSQNIDNLEANAGIDKDHLVQCHGSFGLATCVTCGYEVQGDKIYPAIRNKEIPYCPKCNAKRKKLLRNENVVVQESYGVMKPNITFFGEALPMRFHKVISQDLQDCDLVISIGTSLKVAPVAHIIDKLSPEVPQVLINKDPLHHCNFDVNLLGSCDEVASYLCDRLGESWKIDHPDFGLLVGEDHNNLELEADSEKGVYVVKNKTPKQKEVTEQKKQAPEPDIMVLEPELG